MVKIYEITNNLKYSDSIVLGTYLCRDVTCPCGYLLRVNRKRFKLLQRNPCQHIIPHLIVVSFQFLQNAYNLCRRVIWPTEKIKVNISRPTQLVSFCIADLNYKNPYGQIHYIRHPFTVSVEEQR